MARIPRFRLGFALAAGIGAVLATGAASAEDRALIVAINDYETINDLFASQNDARLVEKMVREQWGFPASGIKLLFDRDASADGIRAAFHSWLVEGTQPGDRVFFYYSGHGYHLPDRDGDEADGQDEALSAWDTAVDDNGNVLNQVIDDDIYKELVNLQGRSAMVMVDSCHSGTITRAMIPNPKPGEIVAKTPIWPVMRGGGGKLPEITVSEEEFGRLRKGNTFARKAKGALAWTAVGPTEVAQEDATGQGEARNGVFTKYFVEGLSTKAADADRNGVVSAGELLQYVRAQAKGYCDNNKCDTGMTPTFEPGADALGRDMMVWPKPDQGGGDTPPPPADIIPVGGSAFEVKLDMVPGRAVKVGDEIKLRVTSSRPGYLIALDMREDGKVVQLFPSTCSIPERKIRAGAPLTMPDPTYGCAFTATEAGKGKIMAIVAEDNVPLDSLLDKNKGLEVISNPSSYLGQIAQALLDVWTGDERNRPVKWGLAVAEYEIR